jgi:DNA mismatch endonuclease (patch repair protein)
MQEPRKDRHTPEQRSYNMSRIRSTNTQLEQRFFKLLDDNKIKYEKHPKLFGKPDCYIKPDVLIFVDSDFWHGWHFNQWRDRLPKEYWVEKIEKNIRRDFQKFRTLRSEGYKVVRIWEHTLMKDPERAISLITSALDNS